MSDPVVPPSLPQGVEELIAAAGARGCVEFAHTSCPVEAPLAPEDWCDGCLAYALSRALEQGRAQAPAPAEWPAEVADALPSDRRALYESSGQAALVERTHEQWLAEFEALGKDAAERIAKAIADALSTASPAPACASCAARSEISIAEMVLDEAQREHESRYGSSTTTNILHAAFAMRNRANAAEASLQAQARENQRLREALRGLHNEASAFLAVPDDDVPEYASLSRLMLRIERAEAALKGQ